MAIAAIFWIDGTSTPGTSATSVVGPRVTENRKATYDSDRRHAVTDRAHWNSGHPVAVGKLSTVAGGPSMAEEIELKLSIAPDQAKRLCKRLPLQEMKKRGPDGQRLVSVYFDTP